MTLMQSMKGEIARALPNHITSDRFLRIVLTEIRKNPELEKADVFSFLGAVIQAAQLGLEPGSGLGHAYLVPFKNNKRGGILEVQFIPGYRGLIDLARRSGQIETISARIVRDSDTFEYEYGDAERIRHKPFEGPDDAAGRITHAYAIARLKGSSEPQREVLTRAQIDRVAKDTVPWREHFDEMARKTAVRRIVKYLPMSPELARALEADDSADEGTQENWRVFPDYEPAPPVHEPAKAHEAIATPTRAYQSQSETAADMENACHALVGAADRLRARGGDPDLILGKSMAAIIDSGSIDEILNTADILMEWKP